MNPLLLALMGIGAAFGLYTAVARASTREEGTGAVTGLQWVPSENPGSFALTVNQRFMAQAQGMPPGADPQGPWEVQLYATAPSLAGDSHVLAKVYATPSGPVGALLETGQTVSIPMSSVTLLS
jgi:hypothetical protein